MTPISDALPPVEEPAALFDLWCLMPDSPCGSGKKSRRCCGGVKDPQEAWRGPRATGMAPACER